jgi:hypothetical protein
MHLPDAGFGSIVDALGLQDHVGFTLVTSDADHRPSGPCLLWVKTGKAQPEHNTSALPPIATGKRTSLEVGLVPDIAR